MASNKRKKPQIRRKRRVKKTPKTIRHEISSGGWGEMWEEIRYRDVRPGKQGRLVHPKDIHKFSPRFYPQREVYHYRRTPDGKKIGTPILVRTRKSLMKKTFPTAVEFYGGNIFAAIEDSNIMGEIHKYQKALLHVRGKNQDGHYVQFQVTIKLGKQNQHKQLVVSARELMAKHGYRTQYDIKLVRFDHRTKARAKRLSPLDKVQFTITAFK